VTSPPSFCKAPLSWKWNGDQKASKNQLLNAPAAMQQYPGAINRADEILFESFGLNILDFEVLEGVV
jgi:hypothetical protein